MGMYVASLPLRDPVRDEREVVMHNTPGRAVAIHPGRASSVAAFMFRHPAVEGFDHRDSAQHKRLLVDTFAGGAWRVPELLEQARAADDLYFDSVSRVSAPRWSNGRVVLLGDAARCVSLFGDGSSLAIAGAATLADAPAASTHDHRAAFRQYEAEHRVLVDPKQRNVATASRLLVPATRYGIAVRNATTRLWPTAGTAQRMAAGARQATLAMTRRRAGTMEP